MKPTRVQLAPMEGLMDAPLRQLITAVGGYDQCTSEFVRVTEQVTPAKVFYRFGPELKNKSRTASGTQFRIQLLGSSPHFMALAAQKAVELGSPSIDLNFGCPAKTVNKSRGGSVLLKEPDVLTAVTQAVCQAVDVPVTVKMRLGYDDPAVCVDNALAFEAAGATELVVHARTKTDAYRPPAHWAWLRDIREALQIPVIANGEIWTPDDWRRCFEASGCDQVMIGRGAVARPDLALWLKSDAHEPWGWPQFFDSLMTYWQLLDKLRRQGECTEHYQVIRIKQWLNQSKHAFDEAPALFEVLKRCKDVGSLGACLTQAQAA